MASAAAVKKCARPSQGFSRRVSDEPEVRLVDQRRGLERLSGLLAGELPGRDPSQLVVNQGQELARGDGVALLDGGEDAGHVGHGEKAGLGLWSLERCGLFSNAREAGASRRRSRPISVPFPAAYKGNRHDARRFTRVAAMRAMILAAVAILLGSNAFAADHDREEAAERGRQALTGRSFVMSAWKRSTYDKAGSQWKGGAPDPAKDCAAYDQQFLARYGLHPAPYPNDGLPMGLRLAPSRDGKTQGIQVDCMLCHGGSIGGTSYVGLGNSQLDAELLFGDLTRAEGRPFPQFFTLNTSRGTVNAGQMSAFLLSLRNSDLSRRLVPLKLDAKLPEIDTPAWWILAKKATQYYDGRTDARDWRTNMQFLLGEKSLQQFKDLEPTFKDIQAYIKSIKPPKYPFAIDQEKARRGEVVFAKNCANATGLTARSPPIPARSWRWT